MQSADFAIGGGAGPASGNARSDPNGLATAPEIGGTLLLNAGFPFLRYKGATLAIEVPVAVHGSRSLDVFARGIYAGFYAERLTAVLSPGVRVRFAEKRRLSPWLSFGTGLAMIRRTGVDFQSSQRTASQSDSNLSLALVPAAGMDLHVSRRWFVRGELRNYLYKTPATGFVSSFPYWNRWNYNPVIAGSLGFRF
jgi:hypothetical protein